MLLSHRFENSSSVEKNLVPFSDEASIAYLFSSQYLIFCFYKFEANGLICPVYLWSGIKNGVRFVANWKKFWCYDSSEKV